MALQREKVIKLQSFDCFQIYSIDDSYSFFHVDIEDDTVFYEKLFEYFFSEDKLIEYCEHTSSIKFTPSEGNGFTKTTISVDENTSDESRIIEITVKKDGE